MTLGPSSSAFVSFLSYRWLFIVATSFVNGPLFSEYFLRKISLPPLNKTETGAGERWRRRAEFLRDKEAAKNVLDIGEAEVGSSSLVAASSCSL